MHSSDYLQIYNIVYSCPASNADGFGAWDNSSCRVLSETQVEVMCGCDHLTHFAILLVSDGLLTGNTAGIIMYVQMLVSSLCYIQFFL